MTALVRYEAARQALAEAQRVDEVKDIRDKAEAMAAYARQAKDNELIQFATEIKVRAERRCGEMLARSERARPEDNLKRGPKSNDATTGTTLAQMGLTKDESSRYQKLAAMPEKHFEAAVATAKAAVGEVTTARMLREAKQIADAANPPKPRKAKPTTSVATETASPVTPDQKAPGPVTTAVGDDDGLGDFDPLDEMKRMQVELDQAHALVKAAEANDLKAEAMKWRRAYDHAQREQSAAMDSVKRIERELQSLTNRVLRLGKLIGSERDVVKILTQAEAMARAQKVAA